MQTLLKDVHFALRHLRRTPGSALLAVLTFALGMQPASAVLGPSKALRTE